jgi:hypothetical protein
MFAAPRVLHVCSLVFISSLLFSKQTIFFSHNFSTDKQYFSLTTNQRKLNFSEMNNVEGLTATVQRVPQAYCFHLLKKIWDLWSNFVLCGVDTTTCFLKLLEVKLNIDNSFALFA